MVARQKKGAKRAPKSVVESEGKEASQHINVDAGGIVIMEDKQASVFCAVEEYFLSDYTPDHFGGNSSLGDRMVRVVLKACTCPDALLPFPVVDSKGKIQCRTLGEAFLKKVPIWWMEGDVVCTCEDGATHTP